MCVNVNVYACNSYIIVIVHVFVQCMLYALNPNFGYSSAV